MTRTLDYASLTTPAARRHGPALPRGAVGAIAAIIGLWFAFGASASGACQVLDEWGHSRCRSGWDDPRERLHFVAPAGLVLAAFGAWLARGEGRGAAVARAALSAGTAAWLTALCCANHAIRMAVW